MALSPEELRTALAQVIEAAARTKARLEMLECVLLALVAKSPDVHQQLQQALVDAEGLWNDRSRPGRSAVEVEALALLSELRRVSE